MNSRPLRPITEDDLEALQRDGVAFLPRMFDGDWIDRLRSALDHIEHRQEQLRQRMYRAPSAEIARQLYYTSNHMWISDPELRAFVFESPAPLIARDIMGCQQTVGLFLDQAFIQQAGDQPSPWHHGRAAFPLLGTQHLNMWIPLDAVSGDQGGLCFVKGSHRWDRYFLAADHPLSARADRRFGEGGKYRYDDIPDIDPDDGTYECLTWSYRPGDVLVFGRNVLHCALGTAETSIHRRALTTRWWGDDARFEYRPEQLGALAYVSLRTGDPMDASPLFPRVLERAGDQWRRCAGDRIGAARFLAQPLRPPARSQPAPAQSGVAAAR